MNLRFFIGLSKDELYNIALWLAGVTIGYNLAEGILATALGFKNETLALFGFGLDSFIEIVSGVGILYMVIRTQKNRERDNSDFELTALKITGYAFYALVVVLVVSSVISMYTNHKPETTIWGVVISSISILVMLGMIYGKVSVGKRLHSDAMLADANCTKVCIYMSVILLLSSGIYELTRFAYIDSIGALGLAWFSLREGRECFEKIKHGSCCVPKTE